MPDFGTKRLQGVIDRDPRGPHSADQAAFANTLGPELGRSLRCLNMPDEDVRHLAGHGNEIVGQRSVEQVRVVATDAFLEQYGSEALDDPTADLLVDQKGVDDATTIIHSPLAEHGNEACLGVDLDVAGLHAISHEVHLVVRDKARGDGKLYIEA